MKNLVVLCISGDVPMHLTSGKEYTVQRETISRYLIYDDTGDEYFHSKRLFVPATSNSKQLK
jgi:hypothetical protein